MSGLDAAPSAVSALREPLLEPGAGVLSELYVVADALLANLAVLGRDLCYRFTNRAFERWFGLRRGEAVGQHIRQIVGEYAWQRVEPHVTRALAGEPSRFEGEIVYAVAGRRRVIVDYLPTRGADGSVEGFLSLAQDVTGEREAEKAAVEILAATTAGFVALDGDLHVRFANGQAAQIAGLEPHQLAGSDLRAAGLGRKFNEVREACEKALREERPQDIELVLQRSERWIAIHVVPAHDGLYLYAMDVTSARRSELRLEHSEERLRLAQRVAGLGTWEWDVRTRDGSASPEMAALLGRAGTLDGRLDTFLAAVHSDDRAAMLGSLDELYVNGHHAIEHRVVRPDGSVRWLDTRGQQFSDASGNPARAIGVSIDITDRKDAERQAAIARRHAELLADVGQVIASAETSGSIAEVAVSYAVHWLADGAGIALYDGAGSDTTALSARAKAAKSDAFLSLARLLAAKSPRRSAGDDTHIGSRDSKLVEARGSTPRAMSIGLTHEGEEIGVLRLVRLHDSDPFDAADRNIAAELAHRISVRLWSHRVTEDLQRANAVKDEVLGLVSHELRTPLTTLRGNANSLRRHGSNIPDEDRIQALQDIERDAERLQAIVENMLALARLEGGRPPVMEPVLLQRIIPTVAEEHRKNFPEQQFGLSVAGTLPPVVGHDGYLRQVLLNLFGNAAKYVGPSARIDVTAGLDARDAFVEVADRGPGMDDETAQRIFDPFYRSNRNAGRAAGMGLGLTVCKRLVEIQGGRISVSPRPGGGAIFAFTLPVLAHHPEPAEDA